MAFVDYITRAPKKNMTPAHVWGRAFAQENYYYQNLMRVKQEAQDFLATRGMSDESARLPQLSSTETEGIGSTRTDNHPLNEVKVYFAHEANLERQRKRKEEKLPIGDIQAELINSPLFNKQREKNNFKLPPINQNTSGSGTFFKDTKSAKSYLRNL